MYKFNDTVKNNQVVNENLSESLIIEGVNIETTIPQIKTLNVTGRGLVDRDISTSKYIGQNGSNIDYSSDSSKRLEVEILVSTKSSKELEQVLVKLNDTLRIKNKLAISFEDDKEYYYEGEFEKFSTPPKGALVFTMEIEFFIPQPYKYSKTLDTYKGTTSIAITKKYKKTVTPEQITLRNITTDLSKINITCGNKKITLVTNKDITGTLVIDLRKLTVMHGVINKTTLLSWESDIEYFYTNGDNPVKCDISTVEVEVKIREVI